MNLFLWNHVQINQIYYRQIFLLSFRPKKLYIFKALDENERCDELAVAASKTNIPAIDTAYEQEQKNLLWKKH